jgi:hypothetical protein
LVHGKAPKSLTAIWRILFSIMIATEIHNDLQNEQDK